MPGSRQTSHRRPPTQHGGFGEGYLRGVFDKSELPQVTRPKARAGYELEPNTLDIMQAKSVLMTPQTHRQVEESQAHLALRTVPKLQDGLHYNFVKSNARTHPQHWAEAQQHVAVSLARQSCMRAKSRRMGPCSVLVTSHLLSFLSLLCLAFSSNE